MSVKLSASTFRLACNQALRDSTTDLLGGSARPVLFWKNSLAYVQGGIFVSTPVAASFVDDLSNIVSVEMVLRAGGPSGALICPEKSVLAADLTAGLTYDQWIAGTGQHFTFEYSPGDLNVAAQKSVWLAIGLTTTDAGSFPIAINSSVEIRDGGLFDPGNDTNPALPYTGWSKAEADARYAAIGAAYAWAPGITSVGDNAAHSLEAVATIALSLPALRSLYNVSADSLQSWLLVASSAATGVDVQRPNDFDPTTNARVWFRK